MPTNDLALRLIRECAAKRGKTLDLGQCGLLELPTELFSLGEHLEELYLCNTYWNYENQKWIYSNNSGWYNLLTNLPPEIVNLKKLKKLYTGGGRTKQEKYVRWKINNIAGLEKLTNLNSLNLQSNQINEIALLEKLTNLNSLNLSYNQ